MSDAKNPDTIEVPRELVDRLLAVAALNGEALFSDLRACIKPRRWEFERRYAAVAPNGSFECTWGLYEQADTEEKRVPVRVIVEEIL